MKLSENTNITIGLVVTVIPAVIVLAMMFFRIEANAKDIDKLQREQSIAMQTCQNVRELKLAIKQLFPRIDLQYGPDCVLGSEK